MKTTLHQIAQPRREVKEHKSNRIDAEISMNRSQSPRLIRKRRAPSISDIRNLEILNTPVLDINHSRRSTSSKSREQIPSTSSHQRRRRRCQRRCFMTKDMLKRDCYKIRRLFQQSKFNLPAHDGQQRKKKCIESTSSEESTERASSTDFLLDECTRSVKDLRLAVTLPIDKSWPPMSSTLLKVAEKKGENNYYY